MAASEGKVVDTATQPADARPRRLHRWAGGLVGTLGGLAHRFATVALLLVIVLIGARAYLSTQGPPLRPWHTIVPLEPVSRLMPGPFHRRVFSSSSPNSPDL